jgi:hypothetical protein
MPLMLYSNAVPSGLITLTVPVGMEQLGCCITLTTGGVIKVGAALMVTALAAEIQPLFSFRTLML